ncbi:hypothetical protein HYFRA_00011588 [Hymenoscyphus fraxineus]|uniref:RING-type E3 ubiquitin transferase n=1 Tax=Hymenoscyphus fraxineus TaxID=746836 RepID=A0A9N9PLR6_9HELO|nr:hypothetical protein HYFRA_00011588 [Hymenoscyphus fraxineus]
MKSATAVGRDVLSTALPGLCFVHTTRPRDVNINTHDPCVTALEETPQFSSWPAEPHNGSQIPTKRVLLAYNINTKDILHRPLAFASSLFQDLYQSYHSRPQTATIDTRFRRSKMSGRARRPPSPRRPNLQVGHHRASLGETADSVLARIENRRREYEEARARRSAQSSNNLTYSSSRGQSTRNSPRESRPLGASRSDLFTPSRYSGSGRGSDPQMEARGSTIPQTQSPLPERSSQPVRAGNYSSGPDEDDLADLTDEEWRFIHDRVDEDNEDEAENEDPDMQRALHRSQMETQSLGHGSLASMDSDLSFVDDGERIGYGTYTSYGSEYDPYSEESDDYTRNTRSSARARAPTRTSSILTASPSNTGNRNAFPTDGETDCPICIERLYPPGSDAVTLTVPCEHAFHYECLRRWFIRDPQKKCPLCRREVDQVRVDVNTITRPISVQHFLRRRRTGEDDENGGQPEQRWSTRMSARSGDSWWGSGSVFE